MVKNVTGIIIRIFDSKEADQIVKIITQNGEKLTLLAKGAKRSRSRKKYAIELGNLVNLSINQKYNIPIITEVKLLNEPIAWKNEFRTLVLLQLVCEILDTLTREGDEDSRFFLYTQQILYILNDNIEFNLAIWMLFLLKINGNLGNLKESVMTGLPVLQEEASIVSNKIGYINLMESEQSKKVDAKLIKIQLYALKTNIFSCNNIKIDDSLVSSLFSLHLNWIEIAIDKKLKTKQLLNNF